MSWIVILIMQNTVKTLIQRNVLRGRLQSFEADYGE